MKKSSSASEKLDRKTIERNRRIHMKGLCFKLASLIPSHHFSSSKDMLSQQDQLGYAATYIQQLKDRIDELQERKQVAVMNINGPNQSSPNDTMPTIGLSLPLFELNDMGSSLEVILITGLKKNFMMYQVISILEEEGAEVVNVSICNVGDKSFHTLHAQVKISRLGIDTSSVRQRLQELIF